MDYLRYYLGAILVVIGTAGFYLGGAWVWLGASTFIPLFFIDILAKKDFQSRHMSLPWLADLPLKFHFFLMVALYASALYWINTAHQLGQNIPFNQALGAVISLAWFNVVPTAGIGHELLHRRDPVARFFGTLLATFTGDPTRDISHIHTHHIHLGTPQDSDTCPRGKTIYTFAFRATIGSFKDFYNLEKQRCAQTGQSFLSPHGRAFMAILQTSSLFAISAWFGGLTAFIIVLSALVLAKLLIEILNYFQHYGIVRAPGSDNEHHHLWNHLSPMTRLIAFEITNHNDHHRDSYIPYYELQPDLKGPQMPSIFLCFLSGLIPPIWFKYIAKPRLKEWDLNFASDAEKELARDANKKAGWPDWLAEEQTSTFINFK